METTEVKTTKKQITNKEVNSKTKLKNLIKKGKVIVIHGHTTKIGSYERTTERILTQSEAVATFSFSCHFFQAFFSLKEEGLISYCGDFFWLYYWK